MSLIQKVRNVLSTHPGFITAAAVFGIGLPITGILGLVSEVFDHSHAALAASRQCNQCFNKHSSG
jgi:hypothetical protein